MIVKSGKLLETPVKQAQNQCHNPYDTVNCHTPIGGDSDSDSRIRKLTRPQKGGSVQKAAKEQTPGQAARPKPCA